MTILYMDHSNSTANAPSNAQPLASDVSMEKSAGNLVMVSNQQKKTRRVFAALEKKILALKLSLEYCRGIEEDMARSPGLRAQTPGSRVSTSRLDLRRRIVGLEEKISKPPLL